MEIKFESVSFNPYMDSDRPMHHYAVTLTLTHNGKTFNTFFSMGITHKKGKVPIDDVLSCLVSDALTAENSPLFEDFCSDLGYDTDSRKAYKT